MNRLKPAITVMQFEWRRSLTIPRLAVWTVLMLFPPAIVLLICVGASTNPPPASVFALILMWLIPQVVCLLALLLWVCPAVHSELEGKTWVYLAVRPGGRSSLMFGKYLTGVLWAATACLAGLTLSIAVGKGFGTFRDPFQLWLVFAVLVLFATAGYGAVFSLIGVLFHRRAMVVAVGYAIVAEFLVTNIPGGVLVKQFTFAFHLNNLLFTWGNFGSIHPDMKEFLLDDASPIQHIVILVCLTGFMLFVANLVVKRREYITAEES